MSKLNKSNIQYYHSFFRPKHEKDGFWNETVKLPPNVIHPVGEIKVTQ